MTPQYIDLFSGLSAGTNINIIAGSQLFRQIDKLYNIAYLFHRDARFDRQYKLHMTPYERVAWGVDPGKAVEVFDTDCGKIAVLIGYDIEFPELSRIAASKGANIMFVPFKTDQRPAYMRVRYCAQARCVENQIYVAISGCTGNTPMSNQGEIHYAQSAIFTPCDSLFSRDGIADECAPNVETMIIQDLDLDVLEHYRETGSLHRRYDRRAEPYQILYKEGTQEYEI